MPCARRTLHHGVVATIFWLVACGVLGCRSEEPHAADAPIEAEAELDPAAIDPEEREQLRALGYTDVAEPLETDAEVGVVLHDATRTSPGLNFLTNAQTCSAQIIDMEGKHVG